MSKCIKCGRSGYLKLSLCREHFYQFHQVEMPFNRIKELNIRKIVQTHLLSFWQNDTLLYNKKLKGTRYLPDLRFTNGGGRTIIMEVDEYAHRRYRNERERMTEIVGACGANVTFIRVNVDGYTGPDGLYYPPIWSKETKVVREKIISTVICNENEWERRKNIIVQMIDIVMDPTFHLPYIYMFYSNRDIV